MGRYTTHIAQVGDGISINDRMHKASMRDGSELLRDRIIQLLADRQTKFSDQVSRHDAARRDIRRGVDGSEVRRRYELSPTAYKQLAAQVRAA